MNKSRTVSVLAGIAFAFLFVQISAATTVYVGTCGTPHYPNIQTAVSSVAAFTTINVCPGNYPEQVKIPISLTLKGVASGNSNAAVITSPNGGLVQNATSLSGQGIEAQIYVETGATVKIQGLTIDAANSNLDSLACGGDPVGIYFQNASGTITLNSVLNDVLSPTYNGCQGGLGIFVESANTNNVNITYNNVENYQKNGITVDGNGPAGLTTTISSNTVIGQGPTNGAGENSIQLAFGATGTISYNTVGSDVWAPDVNGDTGDAAAGILVYASPNVIIKNNTVSNTQFGIAVVSSSDAVADGAQVTLNTVSTTHLYDGIDLCSNNNTATGNKINGSDEAAIHLDDTCTGLSTGNKVTGNTINSACAGVLVGSASSGTTSPNTYYNTINEVLPGSDTCSPAPTHPKGAAKSPGRSSPARP